MNAAALAPVGYLRIHTDVYICVYTCMYVRIHVYIYMSQIVYDMPYTLPLLRHLHTSCLHAPPCSRGGKRFVYIYIIYVLYVQIHIHIICICILAPGSAAARAVKPCAFRKEHTNDAHSLRT